MRDFRLRTDLDRAVVNGFAMPLGISPENLEAPIEGYTVAYTPGEEDDPDTYVFSIVVSHERLGRLVQRAFDLLPSEVYCIVEVGSRDAYRSVDVYLGGETVSLDEFRATWRRYEPLLLEDASIAAGANSEEPFVEVFLSALKVLTIHVPLAMREDVDEILQQFDMEEVAQPWPTEDDDEAGMPNVRPVLDLSNDELPDLDDLLLDLRHELRLELNIDPESNVDEGGRNLGLTLWHAMVIVEPINGDPDNGAYASIWATAGSLTEMEDLIEQSLAEKQTWRVSDIFTIDRVAYDERPDELADLPTRRQGPQVHLVQIEPWPPQSPPGESQPEQAPRL